MLSNERTGVKFVFGNQTTNQSVKFRVKGLFNDGCFIQKLFKRITSASSERGNLLDYLKIHRRHRDKLAGKSKSKSGGEARVIPYEANIVNYYFTTLMNVKISTKQLGI